MKNEQTSAAALDLAHHVEQLVAGAVEIHPLPLAAEHGGGGAEVAAQRAADRGDDRGGHVAGAFLHGDAHGPRADARGDDRVAKGTIFILAEVAAEPPHPFALNDVIGVDPPGQVGDVGDVPADDDGGVRLVLPDQLAHLLDFVDVGDDRRDADHVVLPSADFLDEAVQRGEVQHRARGLDVRLDHHQAPTAVEHPQRERPLRARHLVVVQLHRVHAPAAVLVILAVGAKDAGQQHPGLRAGRMQGLRMKVGRLDFEVAGGHGCISQWAILFSHSAIISVFAPALTSTVYALRNSSVIVRRPVGRRTSFPTRPTLRRQAAADGPDRPGLRPPALPADPQPPRLSRHAPLPGPPGAGTLVV